MVEANIVIEAGEDVIDCMARMKAAGQPFALATIVRTEDLTSAKAGAKAVVQPDGSLVGWVGGGCTLAATRKASAAALADGRARLIRVRPKGRPAERETPRGVELHDSSCPSGGTIELFVEPILPRRALIVAGASPVARALCDLGRRAGYVVTAAALAEDQIQLAEADLHLEGFGLAAAPGAATGAIVVATQGRRDREALAAALATAAPYVAFVGSRRKAETLRAALADKGIPAERLAALRAPAGIDIGAATPAEIALSILAEIVQVSRQAGQDDIAAAPQVEEVEGGSFESEIVSPVRGACQDPGSG